MDKPKRARFRRSTINHYRICIFPFHLCNERRACTSKQVLTGPEVEAFKGDKEELIERS